MTPFPYSYRDVMTEVAQIANSNEHAYTRVNALNTLLRELSPANPKSREIRHVLGLEPPTKFPEAPLAETDA